MRPGFQTLPWNRCDEERHLCRFMTIEAFATTKIDRPADGSDEIPSRQRHKTFPSGQILHCPYTLR